MGLTGLQSMCQQGHVPLRRPQGRICVLAFSSFSRQLTCLTSGFPSFIFKARQAASLRPFFHSDSSLSDAYLSWKSLFKGLRWLEWAHLDNSEYSPHFKVLNLNTSAKSPFSCIQRALEIRTRTPLGDRYSAYQRVNRNSLGWNDTGKGRWNSLQMRKGNSLVILVFMWLHLYFKCWWRLPTFELYLK